MSGILSNPQFLAGLNVMQGQSVGDAIQRGVQVSELQKRAAQRQQVQQALPQLIQQVDPANPTASLGKLIQGGIPTDMATQIIGIAQKQAQQASLNQQRDMEQALMQQYMRGGEGLDSDAAAYIMAGSENPTVAGLGRMGVEQVKERRKEEAEQQKQARKSSIPGYDLREGIELDTTTARAARELVQAIPSYKTAVENAKEIIRKHGSTTGVGTDVDEATEALNDLMNAERQLFNTGVLNVGEKPILESNYATFDPRNPMNLLKNKKQMIEAADNYLENRLKLLDNKLDAVGYQKEGAARDPKTTTTSFQEGQIATNPSTNERIVFRNGEWSSL